MYERIIARELNVTPEQILRRDFQNVLAAGLAVDALFADASMKTAMGVGNLGSKAPVMLELMKNPVIADFLLDGLLGSLLILGGEKGARVYTNTGTVQEIEIPSDIAMMMSGIISGSGSWAGSLNELGEHVVDLKSPPPGPHFNVNLLMGNRAGYSHALQTTPKSVVDRVGRGGFRSHAATQVLATRWDMRQEENGFPANRQFYLTENSRKIFYSADPADPNIASATCTHSQNHTVIRYETKCGLVIERTIFVLPQYDGLPLATEVQQIKITNTGMAPRSLRLVYTGMFGTNASHAVFEDVLYSNVIMQARVLKDSAGNVVAVSPDYYPQYCRADTRFHTMLVHNGNSIGYPTEFCTNCTEFVGSGTLENPEGISRLSNNFYRKGPGFFAVACPIELAAGEGCMVDNFTGLVSGKVNPDFSESTIDAEIGALIEKFRKPGSVGDALNEAKEYGKTFTGFVQVETGDREFDAYFNKNLPFQVLYQTFVSRSFCQTQKGQREIGFREIQDVFASMSYFAGMGQAGFVKQLLKEWCAKVFEFGYAYHNFFWVGKEPGIWSDDALWFIQATHRYISLSGDIGFLDEQCEIANTSPVRTRSVYETIKAILRYSGEISIGKHGMPLLDRADWNDCLSLDNNYVDGITKEKMYRKQIEDGGVFGEPLKSDYSESVMNAFLLKLAIDQMIELAGQKGDKTYQGLLTIQSRKLYDNLQQHAWKGDFFARVLLNRFKNSEYTYMGARGDGLSANPAIDGTYFINSFNWSILSDSATEAQISAMVDSMEAYLKTPYGIKLCSPTDMERIASNTATGHYFPGDRENGAVFKHASMMATAAMFKAAKEVKDKALAARLGSFAYWMIDLVLPYRTMENPYVTAGNPRFCTQYNNSDTGENIGPMLSGTATWLNLTLLSAFGLEVTCKGIELNPVLREEQTSLNLTMKTGKAEYKIAVTKPVGFCRLADGNVQIELDGINQNGNIIPLFEDGKVHTVEIAFK